MRDAKLHTVAQLLNANLVGDDGERYIWHPTRGTAAVNEEGTVVDGRTGEQFSVEEYLALE